MNRWLAIVLWLIAAYVAYIGAVVAYTLIGHLFPWIGPEPEMMIPVVFLAAAAGLFWLGRRVWGRTHR